MLFYRALTILLSPIILGHIVWLSIKNKQSRYFWQRLGFKNSHIPSHTLWFHCASVGEVKTLLPLLKNIHQKDKAQLFTITTNTITGAQIVAQQKLHYLFHSYLPFDWRFSINRFLATAKPLDLYIMETEIWPNLISLCAKKRNVYLINARLSSKTTTAHAWVQLLLKTSLKKVKHVYCRSEHDQQAYRQLVANNTPISLLGNLKLTTAIKDTQTKQTSLSPNREYVLLASTHNDEELQIYKIWKKLNRHELLIIAPRHPNRSNTIHKQLHCQDIAIRSKNEAITEHTEIYLLDTVGELKNYFDNAKVVIMGGSFATIGGHNILEPASYHCAIITGKHMENFRDELSLMLEKKAILQVDNYHQLQTCLHKLLNDDTHRLSLANNATNLTDDAQHILDKYTKIILHRNT